MSFVANASQIRRGNDDQLRQACWWILKYSHNLPEGAGAAAVPGVVDQHDHAAFDVRSQARVGARQAGVADVEAAREAGISSTPAFLINGVLLVGAQPVEAFERVIERELRALAAAP